MMRSLLLFFIVAVSLLTLVPQEVAADRILVILGFSGKSHNHGIGAVTSELARKGHDVTIVTPFPIKNPPGKYRIIDVPIIRELMKSFDIMAHTKANFVKKMNFFFNNSTHICPSILNMPDIKALLNTKFDLVILSVFFNDCFLPFAYYNDAPLILFSPVGLLSWISTSIGNPEPTAYVPNLFLPFSHEMTFIQRCVNTIVYYFMEFMRYYILIPNMNKAAQDFFGPNMPHILDLERNASLILLNSHVSLSYPRPLQPNVIEAGGMHIKTEIEPLPKDLQEYMDGSKHGVIYFSMGSAVRPEDFPPDIIHAILETFRSLHHRIIFKWNLDSLPEQPSNVLIRKWLPQEAILAHPNLKLFITHGGLLSTQEAAYHGVPLVGIPILGDQELNVKQSELIGFAAGVSFLNVTKESLSEAVQRVLSTPSFSEKARQLKKRVRDQPQAPLERAVYWIEYVLRHDGAPHLRNYATNLAWYQLYLLDVAAAGLALLLAFLVFLRFLVRLLCNIVGTKHNRQHVHDEKKRH